MEKKDINLAAVLHAAASDLIVEERKIPTPGPGEVLIRNHAIALNPIDYKRQQSGFLVSSYPLILGAGMNTARSTETSLLTYRSGCLAR
jgi:NADPH:quinone reductase-like Zn-dependent oxidoreductase